MRVRIVVADRGEARFYAVASLRAPLKLAGRLSDSKARLHDRDLTTDRPGRVFVRTNIEMWRAILHEVNPCE